MTVTEVGLDALPRDLNLAYESWKDRGGETMECSWRGFDLLAVPSRLLPTTMVTNVGPTMEESRFRFWGSKLTIVHGYDMTGMCPYDIKPRSLAEALRASHKVVIETRAANASKFVFFDEKGIQRHQISVRLPLSNDGSRVDHIVAVLDAQIAA